MRVIQESGKRKHGVNAALNGRVTDDGAPHTNARVTGSGSAQHLSAGCRFCSASYTLKGLQLQDAEQKLQR